MACFFLVSVNSFGSLFDIFDERSINANKPYNLKGMFNQSRISQVFSFPVQRTDLKKVINTAGHVLFQLVKL